ncbi:hypothetical protein L873DRAFT_1815218, partial [Choiromyces venosus 120613-1]
MPVLAPCAKPLQLAFAQAQQSNYKPPTLPTTHPAQPTLIATQGLTTWHIHPVTV